MPNELDAKICEYNGLKQKQFPIVKSITFSQGIDPIGVTGEFQQQLSLVFSDNESFVGPFFYLELFGVRNFIFEQPTLSVFNLYLEISKIATDDVQASRFAVRNLEMDVAFRCLCCDFVAAISER